MKRLSTKKFLFFILVFLFQISIFTDDVEFQSKVINYLDSHIPQLLKGYGISGTVLTVVKGENVILKAYGTLGYDRNEPMSAENTPMYVASISKLLTATAIFQLYERDKLDLDKDINTYISQFRIDNPYDSPITIHHLLTHTAGFDDRFVGMGAHTRDKVLPLGVYLSKRLPPIVFPPGSAISYSNHGFALLGYLVEVASGMSFNEYIHKNIFEPLEMKNSRFDGTFPETLKLPDAYISYLGKSEKITMDFAQTPPASSLCTTAEDFSHFIIAMLNGGSYKNTLILKPETVMQMQTSQFRLHPLLPGYAYCWEERFINGKRTLQHSGLTWGFSSHTVIIPEEKFGLFISVNKNNHSFIYDVINPLIEKFTLPVKNVPLLWKHPTYVDPSFYEHITGFYRHNRYCRSDYFKLATFLPGFISEIYVKGNARKKCLEMKYLSFYSWESQAVELGDMLWGRRTNSGIPADSPRITFTPGTQWQTHQLVIGNDVYESIYFYETKLFQYILFFVCMGLLLFRILSKSFGFLLPSLFKTHHHTSKHSTYITITAIFFLVYLATFCTYLFMFSHPQTFGYGTPLCLFLFLLLSFALLTLTIIGTIQYIPSLKKIQIYTLLDLLTLLACYGILYLLYYWNFLDFHVRYLDTLNF